MEHPTKRYSFFNTQGNLMSKRAKLIKNLGDIVRSKDKLIPIEDGKKITEYQDKFNSNKKYFLDYFKRK